MPHIVIKTISGPSQKQLQEAAEQIAEVVNRTMGKPNKYICVYFAAVRSPCLRLCVLSGTKLNVPGLW
jgi:phenylpyruvate tautomerase PptA (4-oxalocrotonate tautomerase family)